MVKIFCVSSYSTSLPQRFRFGRVELHHQEGGAVGDARGLLHVVGDDDDRVVALHLHHQVLDLPGRDRVERGAGLVHQDHVGLDGDAAGDAEALLLTARHAEGVRVEPVLDLVPERGAAQRLLDDLVHVALHPEDPRAEGDVVVDRLRERVRLLEDHPDQLADLDRVDLGPVEVLAVVEQLALDRGARDEVVHPVQAADQRALPAARGSDQGRHLALEDVHRDLLDGEASRRRRPRSSWSSKTFSFDSAAPGFWKLIGLHCDRRVRPTPGSAARWPLVDRVLGQVHLHLSYQRCS